MPKVVIELNVQPDENRVRVLTDQYRRAALIRPDFSIDFQKYPRSHILVPKCFEDGDDRIKFCWTVTRTHDTFNRAVKNPWAFKVITDQYIGHINRKDDHSPENVPIDIIAGIIAMQQATEEAAYRACSASEGDHQMLSLPRVLPLLRPLSRALSLPHVPSRPRPLSHVNTIRIASI